MAEPIYKMFRVRLKEAWFQLSKEEQDALLAKVGEAREKVRGKEVAFCNSTWNSEQWWFWGVEEFPDIEAVQQHAKLLEELNWLRYADSETLLGTAWQPEPA